MISNTFDATIEQEQIAKVDHNCHDTCEQQVDNVSGPHRSKKFHREERCCKDNKGRLTECADGRIYPDGDIEADRWLHATGVVMFPQHQRSQRKWDRYRMVGERTEGILGQKER